MDFENQKIIPVDIEKEVKTSFLEYAMSVIVSRALPDVRDGLKPIHRRIVFTMQEDGLTPDKNYRKSASIVGDVMGNYHPHGDAAVYDTLVRLAQQFSLRYPLVDGHGNFGSVDGDPPAAQRYTEAKMTKLSTEMVADIDKDTVDFVPNYDNRLKEPTVLPSRFPNLLVNGSIGIAVGMATNIPPHNLGEVIDAAVYLIDHPDADMDDLMTFIKGPDFPTGAAILGRSGIRAVYATGRGTLKIRSKAVIEEHNNGRYRIAVSEIPYMVNKAKLIERIAELHKEKRIEGISDLRDESDREGMRIVVELKKEANPQVILNQLYKYTDLQSNFTVNLIALVNNQPKTLSLKECLYHYVHFQREIIYRRTRFLLRKALERAHIREGFHIAIDNIDEVVRIIRSSRNEAEAKQRLVENFKQFEVSNILKATGENIEDIPDTMIGMTEIQAAAIVNMRLGQLTGLSADDIERELTELRGKIKEYEAIICSDEKIYAIIKKEMLEIKQKYGDTRRTEIEAVDDDIDIEDLIKEEDCVYTMTQFGYIKRLPASTYRQQRRGGKGIAGMTTREDDIVEKMFVASSHDHILFFTDQGRMYHLKGFQIPEAGRTARGANIVNYLQLTGDEKVTAMLHIEEFEEKYLFMVTAKGTVKRITTGEVRSERKAGIRVLTLDEGDRLVNVLITGGSDDIIICTKKGLAVRFGEQDVRAMGRSAMGVIGIRLSEDDEVISAAPVSDGQMVLSVTEKGYGKRTPSEMFTRHGRGGKGMILHNLTEKTGDIAGVVLPGEDEDDLLMITSSGTIIRTGIDTIRTCGRASQGVIVMRLSEDETINSIEGTQAVELDEDVSEENEDKTEIGGQDGEE